VLEAIEDSKKRVDSIALIHQKLYQGENLASIEMGSYFRAIGQTIFESFGIESDRITLKVDMAEIELDVDTAIPIGLITNELITNSLKHAFKENEKGVISISMRKEEDQRIYLNISDNGNFVEFNSNEKKGTGFGSMLVKLLAKQLGADMETNKENGTQTILRFAIKEDNQV